MPPRVLLSTVPFGEIDPKPLTMLEGAGVECARNPLGRRPGEAELASMLGEGFDAVIAGLEPFTPKVLDAARGLRLISRATVGLETVDLNAARERGVLVAHTPGANAQAVAELALNHLALAPAGRPPIARCAQARRMAPGHGPGRWRRSPWASSARGASAGG